MNAPTLPNLLPDLAIELTAVTGQVFLVTRNQYSGDPCGIHAPGYTCFYVSEVTYPQPTRIRVTCEGDECSSPLRADNESISLDPRRDPASLARDIFRRLPDAQGIYQRANDYKARCTREKAEHAAMINTLKAHGFQFYHDDDHSARGYLEANPNAKNYSEAQEIEIEISGNQIYQVKTKHPSLNQLAQILNIMEVPT